MSIFVLQIQRYFKLFNIFQGLKTNTKETWIFKISKRQDKSIGEDLILRGKRSTYFVLLILS